MALGALDLENGRFCLNYIFQETPCVYLPTVISEYRLRLEFEAVLWTPHELMTLKHDEHTRVVKLAFNQMGMSVNNPMNKRRKCGARLIGDNTQQEDVTSISINYTVTASLLDKQIDSLYGNISSCMTNVFKNLSPDTTLKNRFFTPLEYLHHYGSP